MAKILVVYYSSYGHIEAMAQAQAEGAARVPGTQVSVKRVPELTPPAIAAAAGFRLDQPAPLANPEELADYDAIVFGTPTRFGNMASQMRNFLDQTGPLWARNALVGKVGSVFCSTASQHGGQETTLTSFHSTLLHLGMIIVGVRVVDENDGSAIGFGRALGRAGFEYLMVILLFVPWIIDMLFPIWDPKNQTLHDKVSKAVVITQ